MQVNQLFLVAGVAAAISLICSMLIIFSQRWHGGLSFDHDLSGVQKFHTIAVPRVGGLAVVAGIFFGLLCCGMLFPWTIRASVETQILLLLCASAPAFAAGIVEDLIKSVSVKLRLVATVCSALLASLGLGATLVELDIWGVDALLVLSPIAIAVTAIVVAGGVNAINIIDGFNGLAVCVIIIMSAALGVVGWSVGDSFVALLSALGGGAALGFLLLNYPKGKLFLGDGGAYFLGFWVSEIAVLLLVRNANVNAWQVLAICAYPVIEVLFSMYRRKILKNRSPGAPDALHLHTLVYRRLVGRRGARSTREIWQRNAMVAVIIVPCVAAMAALSVMIGGSILGGMAAVLLQVILYVAFYGRLVRGRWRRKRPVPVVATSETEFDLVPS
jgi:UDP-N-acetylmuramyl pentapeptide phosphotransferase/UDP-N-acetylglucosamine-1-phosphate transferase